MNREMQIREMEDTLNKETERAQDLKVWSLSHYTILGDII
jgi:hypothetical protein